MKKKRSCCFYSLNYGLQSTFAKLRVKSPMETSIMQENKLSAVCERVLDRCLAPSTLGGEGCDNMTMIAVQFKKPIGSIASTDEQSSQSEPAVAESKPVES